MDIALLNVRGGNSVGEGTREKKREVWSQDMSLRICRENVNQFFLHTLSFSFITQILYQSIFHPNPPLSAAQSGCDGN